MFSRLAPLIPTLVTAGVLLTLVFFPWIILSFGFLPPDDALRHAAKVVSGKTWQEILVMRPDITIDHNPGWHWVLAWIYKGSGWDVTRLVQFSVWSMFVLFTIAPLRWFKRPEAWLASLTVIWLVFPYFAERAFTGRPLFVTMTTTLLLLCLWTRPGPGRRQRLGASAALVALSTWIHGTWYLSALVPVVFLLARQWRKALELTVCWAAGTLAGAMLTGKPWTFLTESALIPIRALGQGAPVNSLVGEFQPFTGGWAATAVVVGIVLIWRKATKRPMPALWQDPVFWMALVGLGLGFRVLRFWLDWGIPALALWLGWQIEELLEVYAPKNSSRRLAVTALLMLTLKLGIATDRNARWSHFGTVDCLDAQRPDHAGWVPDSGGILYAVDLSVFYQTFFRNPHGDWRYILGFEPSFMRPEDLAVYQELWRTLNAVKACTPWVQRMTAADRLVLHGGPTVHIPIASLEWYYAAANTWVGRTPRQPAPGRNPGP